MPPSSPACPKPAPCAPPACLPRSGTARSRFPTAQALISLAGAAPSTRQSGKVRVVGFRWAVDKQLRGAVMDFAGDSHHANAWAADRYWKARDRGKDHSHATRILARAWLLSSGAAGKTTSPTTPPSTAPTKPSKRSLLDTGLLLPLPVRATSGAV